MFFWDQELMLLILFLFLFLLGMVFEKLRLCPFGSDRIEIWRDCPSSKYASIDAVGFSICRHTLGGGHDVISRRA